MGGYLLRRLALILPTLLGILLINFAIVQAAPGGPVDQAIARLQGTWRSFERPSESSCQDRLGLLAKVLPSKHASRVFSSLVTCGPGHRVRAPRKWIASGSGPGLCAAG